MKTSVFAFVGLSLAITVVACGSDATGNSGGSNGGSNGGSSGGGTENPSGPGTGSTKPTKGAYGETGCSKGDDCEGGHCLVTRTSGVCSMGCRENADCPNAQGYSWYCEVTGSVCKPDQAL